MAPGYGSKIYRKQKKFASHKYFIVSGILLVIFFIFLSQKKDSKINSKPTSSNEIFPSDSLSEKKQTKKLYKDINSNFKTVNNDVSNPKNDPDLLIESNYDTVIKNGYIKPDNANREIAGDKLYSAGKYSEAISEYQFSLQEKESLISKIGVCYFKLSNYTKAVEFLRIAKKRGFFFFLTRKFLALSLYKMNKLEESMENAEEAIEFRKDNELNYLISKIKKEISVMSDYKDQRSGKFLIQFSRIEHSEIRIIVLDLLKEAYKEIGKKLNFYPQNNVVVILYNGKTFFDITRAPGWAGGLYDGKIRIPITGVKNNLEMLKRVIFHEYTHVLISLITSKCPLWLNEGMAEFFSEKKIKKIGQLIPLNLLENHFPIGNKKAVSLAYLESYSAVSYIADKYGVFKLKELLEELNKRDINDAFETVFYISYSNFLKRWGRNGD